MNTTKRISSALLLLLGLTAASLGFAQGTVEQIKVYSPALEGNLIGDSPERDVFVYLPPGYYEENSEKRYPVVYMLHGYGIGAETWMSFAAVENGSNSAMSAAGDVQEMIVVSPDAFNFFAGSMYSASLTIGDWEHFIAEDLVAFIDSNYRTLATRESRGLGGHSMGGYGTLRIGMKFPEVFSVLYPMSACCLADAAANENGMDAAAAMTREDVAALTGFGRVLHARAASWSANPEKAPLFMDFPYSHGAANEAIRAKWHGNSINALADQYTFNLRRYTAIKLDIGTADTLLKSNIELDALLTRNSVPHEFETYEGDHVNRVPERFEKFLLPFFGEHLNGE
jgi:enterochelin esterase-like enzyme